MCVLSVLTEVRDYFVYALCSYGAFAPQCLRLSPCLLFRFILDRHVELLDRLRRAELEALREKAELRALGVL